MEGNVNQAGLRGHPIYLEPMRALGAIVAIYSSIPQQGKSEIKKYLIERRGFREVKFAYVLKKMAKTFLISFGYTDQEAERYIEVDKHLPLQRIPGMPTSRWIQQSLGTDWGRHLIHPELWVMRWEMTARTWSRSGVGVVADDLRFPNEVESVRRLGGSTWRVERPDVKISPEVLEHASEGRLNEHKFNRVIVNDGSIEDLYKAIDKALPRTGGGGPYPRRKPGTPKQF